MFLYDIDLLKIINSWNSIENSEKWEGLVKKSNISPIDEISSFYSKAPAFDKLNFFIKPTPNEFYKQVEKEQRQMEGYLGENPDDSFAPFKY